MKTKNCGNCRNFLKLKSMEDNGGICDFLDGRTNSDGGHNCNYWHALKYERPKKIKIKDLTLD